MLMKTDKKLLRRLEILDRLDEPSLERLSYLLRHKELWPKGFRWDFSHCANCAMGLAGAFWRLPIQNREQGVDAYYQMMTRTFGSGLSHIFCGNMGYRLHGLHGLRNLQHITPQMVADKIDEHLASRAEKEKMAQIGEPEKRRILVPDETPQPAPQKTPEPKPAKVPEREPA